MPLHSIVRPMKTILPNTLAPGKSSSNIQPPSQVYVPAMTSVGTTILLRLEEAQQHLQNGKVTFLPTAHSTVSVQNSTQNPVDVMSQPNTSGQAGPIAHSTPIHSPKKDEEHTGNIMRDKVALNLPVVMTKRTNKKLAQDNPFFKIRMNSEDLEGICRMCESSFLFKN